MRISDNSLKAMLNYYHRELDPVQGAEETRALFDLAVEHYLSLPRAEINKSMERRLQHSEILDLYDCAKTIKSGKPIQQILGVAWFMNLPFKVNQKVLIPRPETEELCDLILRENKNVKRILDIGTGSGCIPVALKKNIPNAELHTVDICAEALDTALENALLNETEIQFHLADALAPDFSSHFPNKFDLMVSNPPYVLRSESEKMEKQVLDHEPHLALFVEGQDPILFYRKIIEHCSSLLSPGGKLYFELNPLTANQVELFAKDSGLYSEIHLIKDISGKTRFLKAIRS